MHKVTRNIFTAAALALALLHPSAAHSSDVARGLALVEKNCARCHAVDRNGTSPRAEAPPFRSLSSRYPLDSLAEALAEGIVTGHNDMPEFRFAPHDIDAIIGYLKSISAP